MASFEGRSFEERSFEELSLETVRRLKIAATRSIEDFSVCFVLGDSLAGSGILVDAFGKFGVLTASHVTRELMRYSDRDLSLIIANHPHRFELPRDCIDDVPLGQPDGLCPEDGPDLSFIRIAGPDQLSTIRSKKSFYRIDSRPFSDLSFMPPKKLFWWLAGAPASLAKPMTSTSPEGALVAKFLIAEASFLELAKTNDDGWDVLTLDVNAEAPSFAEDYRGYSGGGVWVTTLTKPHPGAGDETIDIDACRLAGVMYHQGDLIDGRRVISANGPDSLQKLCQFKTAD